MFDFSFSELMLVGVVALVVLGPDKLPKVARTAGQFVARLQRMINSVKDELSTQLEMEELKKAKQSFESTAHQLHNEMQAISTNTKKNFDEISNGLDMPAWERLPEQHTPADFGVDEHGDLKVGAVDNIGSSTSYHLPSDHEFAHLNQRRFLTMSLHKQAMRRKRDMRPRYRPQPKLRVRKK